MILPAAGFDGLTSLDIQQPGPLIDQLLEMPQGQPLPCPHVYENVPLLSVPHIMPQHLAGIAGQLHGSGRTCGAWSSGCIWLSPKDANNISYISGKAGRLVFLDVLLKLVGYEYGGYVGKCRSHLKYIFKVI